MQFYKKQFSLPQYTPSWFIRMETKCTPIKYSLIKNALLFFCKIYFSDPNTIVNNFYLSLRSNVKKIPVKQNWFYQLHEMLSEYKCQYVLYPSEDYECSVEIVLIFRVIRFNLHTYS